VINHEKGLRFPLPLGEAFQLLNISLSRHTDLNKNIRFLFPRGIITPIARWYPLKNCDMGTYRSIR
jgi:hypothetical protein